MRLRFTAEMIDDNGERISNPVEIEAAVPNLEDYGDKSHFYEIFDRYEKSALAMRNQVAEEITQSYLKAAAALKKGRKEGKSAR